MTIFSLCKKIRHNNRNYRNRQRVPDIVVSNSEASEGDDVDAGEELGCDKRNSYFGWEK